MQILKIKNYLSFDSDIKWDEIEGEQTGTDDIQGEVEGSLPGQSDVISHVRDGGGKRRGGFCDVITNFKMWTE